MKTNTNSPHRTALESASHLQSYDPSAPYRALLNPPSVPSTEIHPKSSDPMTNIDPKAGVIRRIPQFYYPRYNENDQLPPLAENQPNGTIHPNVQQTSAIVQDPHANQVYPYSQAIPVQLDPAAAGPYFPYGTPYLIPLNSNAPPIEHTVNPQEQARNDAITAHQKDADLSRLEVYHFVPKSQSSVSPPGQPIIQYHVYPQAPAQMPNQQPPPQMPYQQPPLPFPQQQQQQQQQQYPPYPYPWYANHPNNMPPYVPEPVYPPAEMKARASQTEPPETKNRAISPIQIAPTLLPAYNDDDGYPYIHHKTMPTDRYRVPTGRIDHRFYDPNRSTPLADCRCLDCQRERSKTLNYYPD